MTSTKLDNKSENSWNQSSNKWEVCLVRYPPLDVIRAGIRP